MVTRNGERFNQRTGRPYRAARQSSNTGCQYCHDPRASVLIKQARDADGVVHKTRLVVCDACRIRNAPTTAPTSEVI